MKPIEPMEPIVIFPVSGGNSLYVEPVREHTEWIGRRHGYSLLDIEEAKKFLEEHFKKLGGNRGT